MDIQEIDIKLIQHNPWQPRTTIDPAAIAELAESIVAQGLLQPPVARSINGHYELAFGHRRLLAWQKAKPGAPMPVQVRELTDRQMAEYAATENAARKDLDPIERAAAIKRLIDEFGMNQVEAGKLFGMASQGAVSNAMRLLKLPKDVQQLLARGELAERHARALLPLMRTSKPKLASQIAADLAKLDESDRDEELAQKMHAGLHGISEPLGSYHRPWPMEWPVHPIHVEKPDTKKGEPGDVPACKGCEFAVTIRGDAICIRTGCHALKMVLFAKLEAERVSKNLGIAVAAAGETVELLAGHTYTYGYGAASYKELFKIAAARELLRIIPAGRKEHEYERKDVLGSEMTMLATVNAAGLKKLTPAKVKEKAKASRNPYAKARAARALECKRLCKVASAHFAERLPTDQNFLGLVARKFAAADGLSHDKAMAKFNECDVAGKRAQLAYWILLDNVEHFEYSSEATPGKASKKIMDLAASLKVKLPSSWDTKPDAELAKKPAAKKAKK